MPVSPADFALWARATGNKYPETAEEKISAAPHAYNFARNLGRTGETMPNSRVGGTIFYDRPESTENTNLNSLFGAPVTPDNRMPKVSGTVSPTLTSEHFVNQEQQENVDRQRQNSLVSTIGKTALAAGTIAAGVALARQPGVQQAAQAAGTSIKENLQDIGGRVSSFLGGLGGGRNVDPDVVRNSGDVTPPTTSQRYHQQELPISAQEVQLAKGAPTGSVAEASLNIKPVTESQVITSSQTFAPVGEQLSLLSQTPDPWTGEYTPSTSVSERVNRFLTSPSGPSASQQTTAPGVPTMGVTTASPALVDAPQLEISEQTSSLAPVANPLLQPKYSYEVGKPIAESGFFSNVKYGGRKYAPDPQDVTERTQPILGLTSNFSVPRASFPVSKALIRHTKGTAEAGFTPSNMVTVSRPWNMNPSEEAVPNRALVPTTNLFMSLPGGISMKSAGARSPVRLAGDLDIEAALATQQAQGVVPQGPFSSTLTQQEYTSPFQPGITTAPVVSGIDPGLMTGGSQLRSIAPTETQLKRSRIAGTKFDPRSTAKFTVIEPGKPAEVVVTTDENGNPAQQVINNLPGGRAIDVYAPQLGIGTETPNKLFAPSLRSNLRWLEKSQQQAIQNPVSPVSSSEFVLPSQEELQAARQKIQALGSAGGRTRTFLNQMTKLYDVTGDPNVLLSASELASPLTVTLPGGETAATKTFYKPFGAVQSKPGSAHPEARMGEKGIGLTQMQDLNASAIEQSQRLNDAKIHAYSSLNIDPTSVGLNEPGVRHQGVKDLSEDQFNALSGSEQKRIVDAYDNLLKTQDKIEIAKDFPLRYSFNKAVLGGVNWAPVVGSEETNEVIGMRPVPEPKSAGLLEQYNYIKNKGSSRIDLGGIGRRAEELKSQGYDAPGRSGSSFVSESLGDPHPVLYKRFNPETNQVEFLNPDDPDVTTLSIISGGLQPVTGQVPTAQRLLGEGGTYRGLDPRVISPASFDPNMRAAILAEHPERKTPEGLVYATGAMKSEGGGLDPTMGTRFSSRKTTAQLGQELAQAQDTGEYGIADDVVSELQRREAGAIVGTREAQLKGLGLGSMSPETVFQQQTSRPATRQATPEEKAFGLIHRAIGKWGGEYGPKEQLPESQTIALEEPAASKTVYRSRSEQPQQLEIPGVGFGQTSTPNKMREVVRQAQLNDMLARYTGRSLQGSLQSALQRQAATQLELI